MRRFLDWLDRWLDRYGALLVVVLMGAAVLAHVVFYVPDPIPAPAPPDPIAVLTAEVEALRADLERHNRELEVMADRLAEMERRRE